MIKILISILLLLTPWSINAAQISDADQNIIDSLKLEISKSGSADTSKVLNYIHIGEQYYQYSLDSMLRYSQKAIEHSQTVITKNNFSKSDQNYKTLKKLEALALNNIGIANYKLGNIDKALSNFIESLKIKKEIDDKKGASKALNNIATIYNSQGKILEAMDYYFQSLKIKEELDDSSGIAITHNNIGSIYSMQGNLLEAKLYFQKSNEIYTSLLDSSKIALTLNSLGGIYSDISKNFELEENHDSSDYYLATALKYYIQSLEIREIIEDHRGSANSFNNVGKVYYRMSTMQIQPTEKEAYQDSALIYFQKAIHLFEELDSKYGLSFTNLNLGGLYFDQSQLTEAETCAQIAYDYGVELGYPEEISRGAKLLSQIYEKRALKINGATPKKTQLLLDALGFYKQHVFLRDSLINADNKEGVIKQKIIYSYSIKAAQDSIEQQEKLAEKDVLITRSQKEIVVEKTKNTYFFIGLILVAIFGGLAFYKSIIAQKQKNTIEGQKILAEKNEKEMKTTLVENEVLLTEIHHRVKNNLQIITSLIYLQIDKSTNAYTIEVLEKTRERIKSIALIHEKLYSSESYDSIDFESYMQRMIADYEIIYNLKVKNIEIKLNLAGLFLDLERSAPLGLLMNELITNAIKYAFDDKGGVIKICSSEKDNNQIIEIKDNGKGFPENINDHISDSVGLRLVTGLVRQIGGSMELKNDNGATVIIKCKKTTQ